MFNGRAARHAAAIRRHRRGGWVILTLGPRGVAAALALVRLPRAGPSCGVHLMCIDLPCLEALFGDSEADIPGLVPLGVSLCIKATGSLPPFARFALR